MKKAAVPSILVVVVVVLLALCVSAEAQQPKKVPRIGILESAGVPSDSARTTEAFHKGLHDLGYVKERTF
jgi:hypothetical protein